MAILTDRNRTLFLPYRLGMFLGAIGEGEEWDYDWGGEWQFSPIVIALSYFPIASAWSWGTIGEGEEWDYDWGWEWQFSPIVIALSSSPIASACSWGAIGEGGEWVCDWGGGRHRGDGMDATTRKKTMDTTRRATHTRGVGRHCRRGQGYRIALQGSLQ